MGVINYVNDIGDINDINYNYNIFLNDSLPLNIQEVISLDECKKNICDLTFYYNDTNVDIVKKTEYKNNLEIIFDDLSIKTKNVDDYINDIFNYLDIDITTKYKSDNIQEQKNIVIMYHLIMLYTN